MQIGKYWTTAAVSKLAIEKRTGFVDLRCLSLSSAFTPIIIIVGLGKGVFRRRRRRSRGLYVCIRTVITIFALSRSEV